MNAWLKVVVLLLLLAGIATTHTSTAQDATTGDVPMFRGGPARTGEMPGPGPGGKISALWTWEGEEGAYVLSSPAVVNGVIYVGTEDGVLYAIGGEGAV